MLLQKAVAAEEMTSLVSATDEVTCLVVAAEEVTSLVVDEMTFCGCRE